MNSSIYIIITTIALSLSGILIYMYLRQKNAIAQLIANLKEAEVQQRDFLGQNNLISAENNNLRQQSQSLLQDKAKLEQELKERYAKEVDLEKELAKQNENNRSLQEKLEGQKEEVEKLQKQMKIEFENIANEILEKKSEKFTKQNSEAVGQLLDPLQKSLGEFKEQIQKNLTEETKQRSSLEEQMRVMLTQSAKISSEANNLASALKGKSKIRGNWGELVLERVLESSGLQEGREYELEKSFTDSESGRRQRPDALIFLPGERTVVVDSKVSLVAYDLYCSSEDETQQQQALAAHLASIKGHIDTLATKRYEDKLKEASDFTIMFVPIEPAYMLAIEKDNSLWDYAFKRRIMLISPSNLMPCLRLINDVWQRERQSLNSQKIVERGERLYEKCVGFVESMAKVGDAIARSQAEFDKAQKQLSSGAGNVFSQARMLRDLGLKSTKELPDWGQETQQDAQIESKNSD